ncbi:hypothetical protein IC762_12140 [Bradyrhizobium genosp. L]|uniref:hypothetical protein n=1 Tax=Bradyrhizobium genosp. L TaxID=83637 RepID=UPI0018A28F8C|nr:hypothetical protein [Bradyrhizobium genosp. L]QPF86994.1 hypothetical protein IC762_12140 [Bradyrhizobium genosp. L]
MAAIYLVICGHNEPYVAERDLKDMSREGTIRDLARGEWGNIRSGERVSLSSIIEVGSDKDVTDEFIAAASMYLDSLVPADLQAARFDHARDLRKNQERV